MHDAKKDILNTMLLIVQLLPLLCKLGSPQPTVQPQHTDDAAAQVPVQMATGGGLETGERGETEICI